jgi:hypothetical protein
MKAQHQVKIAELKAQRQMEIPSSVEKKNKSSQRF